MNEEENEDRIKEEKDYNKEDRKKKRKETKWIQTMKTEK